jgi:hypothetical protein
MNFRKIAAKDGTARQEKAARVMDAAHRVFPVGQKVTKSFAPPEPIAVETGNGQHIRDVDLLDKLLRRFGDFREESNSLRIDRRMRLVRVHGRSHSADEIGLQVRVLTSQHRMDSNELPLKF